MTAAVSDVNPTLARRELAVFFSGLRERKGLLVDHVAQFLGVSQSMASRLDTGARGFNRADAERLADFYDLGPSEKERVLALVDESRRRAWWQKIDLPDPYRTLIGFEQAAETIFEYTALVIPGLLQTREYAEASAIAMLGESDDSAAAAKDIADVRMRRQKILARSKSPDLAVVIDEGALARGAGTPDVMRAQLEHLMKLSRRDEIQVQVLPFSAGLYPSETVQFIVLELPGAIPDVYYAELLATPGKDTADEETVRDMKRLARRLQSIALDPASSRELIASYAKQH